METGFQSLSAHLNCKPLQSPSPRESELSGIRGFYEWGKGPPGLQGEIWRQGVSFHFRQFRARRASESPVVKQIADVSEREISEGKGTFRDNED